MSKAAVVISWLGLLGTLVAAQDEGHIRARKAATMTEIAFGSLPDGRPVTLYELTNANGVVVRVMNYGGTVQAIEVPDRERVLADVVLGYDDLEGYLEQTSYFGTIIGRYGNRIGGARFELDGKSYPLAANNGPNHLHGGEKGFDKVLWSAKPIENSDAVGVTLTYGSVDGEEGYPGALSVEVDYRLTDRDELVIDYRATTDKTTIVNLTNHSYFNLSGAADILDHELWIDADRFTPVDDTLIPTGSLREVADTPFDFRYPMAIGSRIEQENEQLGFGAGYDHNYVLRRPVIAERPTADGGEPLPILAARAIDPKTGRILEVHTTEPGLQFYTGNWLAGPGKAGQIYGRRSGFCLETQHFPDSPNKPDFPSTVLRPGEQYRSRTIYRFSTTD